MANVSHPQDVRNELRSACSPSVNSMLFIFVGPEALNTAIEEELLNDIKCVAMKAVHPEVYSPQFFAMRQSDEEPITSLSPE